MNFQTLNRKAMGCMYVSTGIITLISIAVITFIMYFFSLFSYPVLKVIYIVLVILMAADEIISPPFRYRRYRYAIDEECIDIREGYLWIEEHIVPIERLHQIEMSQGPIDRLFGLTKVIVTTAGGEVTIRFLEYEKARRIADTLKAKINQIAIEEREHQNIMAEPCPPNVKEPVPAKKEDSHE